MPETEEVVTAPVVETTTQTQPINTNGTLGKPRSVSAAEFNEKQNVPHAETENIQADENSEPVVVATTTTTETVQPPETTQAPVENAAPALSEDSIKEYFKSQGIEFSNLDELKSKLNPSAQPTPEELKRREAEQEKRELNFHLDNGGTPEQYTGFKQILNVDTLQLGKTKAIQEAIEDGHSIEEAEEIVNASYFQTDIESLEIGEDETDSEFEARKQALKKKFDFGSKKLLAKGQAIKDQAAQALEGIRTAISESDLQRQGEEQFVANVDTVLSKIPRKMTLELGEEDNQKLPSVQVDVPESVIREFSDLLKDAEKRNNFFFNQDGTLNLENLVPLVVRGRMAEKASRVGYVEGRSSQVAAFQQIFPATSAQQVGVGGSTSKPKVGNPNTVTHVGTPRRANRPQV